MSFSKKKKFYGKAALRWSGSILITSRRRGGTEAIRDITKPFSEEEIKVAVYGVRAGWLLRPDSFPTFFYHNFWDTVKPKTINLLDSLHEKNL